MKEMTDFHDYYVKTHLRIPAYLIGLISGAIIYDHKQTNWKLPVVIENF